MAPALRGVSGESLVLNPPSSTGYLHLSTQSGRRTKVGGLQLEIGALRAPRLLVNNIQGGFLPGSALKVLRVRDGKIPTKKVKVKVSFRENGKF